MGGVRYGKPVSVEISAKKKIKRGKNNKKAKQQKQETE